MLTPLISFLCGILAVFGFAPFYWYPATIIATAGIFLIWKNTHSIKQALYCGFGFGLGLFGAGIYWIFISLHVYGNMPILMAAISTLLLAAFLALFPAATGAFSKMLCRNQNQLLFITVPALWAITDWIRGWIFTGFPWLSLGYSQIADSPLSGYVPVLGVYGVSFLTMLCASLIVELITSLRSKRSAYIVPLAGIVAFGILLKQIPWTNPISKPFAVSLLQGNIDQSIKWEPEIAEATIHQYLSMAAQSKAKLIVLPETAMPVLSSNIPSSVIARFTEIGKQNGGDVLVGVVEKENGEFFNSVLSYGSAEQKVYRKSHLVPFGEYIPLKAIFGWIYRDWLNMPLSDLSRGNLHQKPVQVAGEKVAINICYEDVFGEEIIRQLPEATLLVNVSNDAWYGHSFAADQHMQFSQARALETGRMMLRATNTGATAIINHRGEVLKHAPHFVTTTLEGMAQGYQGSTPYIYWGNWPFLIGSFSLLGWLWRRNKNTNR